MTAFISRYAGRFVKVRAPFAEKQWGKFDAVRWFLRHSIFSSVVEAGEQLLRTLSCFSPEEGRCMMCPACFRWWVALKWVGVDGVPEFLNVGHASEYVRKASSGEIKGERAEALLEMVAPWVAEKQK